MLSKVYSAAVNGIDAYPVEVEVNCAYRDTIFALDGLSKDSTMAALAAVGDAVTGFCEKISEK